jgi:broad specificity phosphatase PhoE
MEQPNHKEYLFIRHAESRYNARLSTSLDSGLSRAGFVHARQTAEKLRSRIDNIENFVGLTSPYLRCLQTAELIRQELGISFLVMPNLREIMVTYDLCTVPARHEEFAEFDWGLFPESATFYRETEEEYIERMTLLRDVLASPLAMPMARTLVLSHGSPCCTLHQMFTGQQPECNMVNYVRNCSVTYVKNGECVFFGESLL